MSRDYYIDNMHLNLSILEILQQNIHRYDLYLKTIEEIAPVIFLDVKNIDPTGSFAPGWKQGFFTWLDALSLCAALKQRNPSTYLEVGSGNSTRFARWCIDQYGLRTKIISVDPEPRIEVSQISDVIYEVQVQDSPSEIFSDLQEDDLLFYDGSHDMNMKSDMSYICFDVIPKLNKGVLIGFHDTYIPILSQFDEDYFISALLLGGDNYIVEFPAHYLSCVNPQTRDRLLKLLSLPGALEVKEFHENYFHVHRSNISGDVQGFTCFISNTLNKNC